MIGDLQPRVQRVIETILNQIKFENVSLLESIVVIEWIYE